MAISDIRLQSADFKSWNVSMRRMRAERAARECVNLPLYEKVTEREAERVLRFLCENAERTG
jgi:dTDP-4-amino-4,6-dideoxygalactose transaminase